MHWRIVRCRRVLSFALLLGGCMASRQEAHQFPSTWPGSQRLSEDAPTVSLQPIDLGAAASPADTGGDGLPSAAVLTVLLMKHLHASGVNAVLEPAPEATAAYRMGCAVPQLGYTEKPGYPQEFRYDAELDCTLTETEGQKVVWKRSLTQRYETTTLLNMLSKMPESPHRHDRVLYRECIVPLWDAMASSVRSALVNRPSSESSPTTTPN